MSVSELRALFVIWLNAKDMKKLTSAKLAGRAEYIAGHTTGLAKKPVSSVVCKR